MTWSRCLPFVRLGLLTMFPLSIVMGVVIQATSRSHLLESSIVTGLVMDLLLTFVTPALALTTCSAGEAMRIGVSTARSTWPASAPYVVAVPLAIVIVGQLGGLAGPAAGVVGLVGSMLSLLFAGAVLRFYERTRDPETYVEHPYGESDRHRTPTVTWAP